MYLVKNHHEPIISRADFNRVQEEMARRSAKRAIAIADLISLRAHQDRAGQIQCQVCAVRAADLRRMRGALPPSDMDGKRLQGNKMAVHKPNSIRQEEMPQLPYRGRTGAPQSNRERGQ